MQPLLSALRQLLTRSASTLARPAPGSHLAATTAEADAASDLQSLLQVARALVHLFAGSLLAQQRMQLAARHRGDTGSGGAARAEGDGDPVRGALPAGLEGHHLQLHEGGAAGQWGSGAGLPGDGAGGEDSQWGEACPHAGYSAGGAGGAAADGRAAAAEVAVWACQALAAVCSLVVGGGGGADGGVELAVVGVLAASGTATAQEAAQAGGGGGGGRVEALGALMDLAHLLLVIQVRVPSGRTCCDAAMHGDGASLGAMTRAVARSVDAGCTHTAAVVASVCAQESGLLRRPSARTARAAWPQRHPVRGTAGVWGQRRLWRKESGTA